MHQEILPYHMLAEEAEVLLVQLVIHMKDILNLLVLEV